MLCVLVEQRVYIHMRQQCVYNLMEQRFIVMEQHCVYILMEQQ